MSDEVALGRQLCEWHLDREYAALPAEGSLGRFLCDARGQREAQRELLVQYRENEALLEKLRAENRDLLRQLDETRLSIGAGERPHDGAV